MPQPVSQLPSLESPDHSPPAPTGAGEAARTGEALAAHERCQRWMSAVARGDRDAFVELFNHFAPRVKAYLVRSGSQESVAEELAQESMLTLWKRAHDFEPSRGSLATWIFTIARNLRNDHYRRSAVRGAARTAFLDVELWEEKHGVIDARPGPDEYFQATQRERCVRAALAQLATEQALLLQLFFFEERPHATIAHELGLPLGTVKWRLRSAVAQMRRLLDFP